MCYCSGAFKSWARMIDCLIVSPRSILSKGVADSRGKASPL